MNKELTLKRTRFDMEQYAKDYHESEVKKFCMLLPTSVKRKNYFK